MLFPQLPDGILDREDGLLVGQDAELVDHSGVVPFVFPQATFLSPLAVVTGPIVTHYDAPESDISLPVHG